MINIPNLIKIMRHRDKIWLMEEVNQQWNQYLASVFRVSKGLNKYEGLPQMRPTEQECSEQSKDPLLGGSSCDKPESGANVNTSSSSHAYNSLVNQASVHVIFSKGPSSTIILLLPYFHRHCHTSLFPPQCL